MIVLNFCFKELRFGLHADSIILMNFLQVPGSIEGGFIYWPNASKCCISCCSSSYSTRCSQSGGNFFVVPKFQLSIHKSAKQFGHSIPFDSLTIWKALPDEVHTSLSLASFRKQLKTYLYTNVYSPQSFFPPFCCS